MLLFDKKNVIYQHPFIKFDKLHNINMPNVLLTLGLKIPFKCIYKLFSRNLPVFQVH